MVHPTAGWSTVPTLGPGPEHAPVCRREKASRRRKKGEESGSGRLGREKQAAIEEQGSVHFHRDLQEPVSASQSCSSSSVHTAIWALVRRQLQIQLV